MSTPPAPSAVTAPPKAAAAISVSHLECGYDGKVVLSDINFEVAPAELFFVIGGSGCGKSTLLRNLIGLNIPSKGDVQFLGRSFLTQDEKGRRELLKTFGVLFQSGALWSSLTLRENVCLPLELHSALPRQDREQLATLKLSQVGLTGFEDYYPSEISGGMRKRAGFARALALDPAIVFFDEPSAGLDPISSRSLDELIVRIRDTFGTTCVVVSHELASIMGIGDRVILLDRETKGIAAMGKPGELASNSENPRVKDFFSSGAIHTQ